MKPNKNKQLTKFIHMRINLNPRTKNRFFFISPFAKQPKNLTTETDFQGAEEFKTKSILPRKSWKQNCRNRKTQLELEGAADSGSTVAAAKVAGLAKKKVQPC